MNTTGSSSSVGGPSSAEGVGGATSAKGESSSLPRDEKTCRLWGCPEPRLLDRHVLQDFCCRGHAQLAKARGEWPRPASKGSSTCSLPGCNELVYRDADTGEVSEYCSMKHVGEAKRRECLRPECSRTAFLANTAGASFCSRACADEEYGGSTTLNHYFGEVYCALPGCWEDALHFGTWRSLHFCCEAHRVLHACCDQGRAGFGHPSSEPYATKEMLAYCGNASVLKLQFLDVGHPEYSSLVDQFTSKWQHTKPVAGVEVVDVIKIEMGRQIRERHEDYKTMVPNVRRRFHGTSCCRECRFYVGGSMCLRPDCGLCSIAMHGFKIEDNVGRSPARNRRPRWLTYGRGIYFSSVSGKANDFSALTAKKAADGAWIRCMLVADVAAGNALVTTDHNFPPAWTPPPGFHSVVGEVGPNLKYDELVCYDPPAALPTHFVVYRQ